MHRTLAVSSALLLASVACSPVAQGCSAVLLQLANRPVMARNYDWHIGNALLMINQPGIAKRALAFDNPAEWTSKYGSVTVNQYGRELPVDGINQQGLAIAVLWLDETEYPAVDERPSVSAAQWVQYQLDTASSVAEVVESDNKIRINSFGGVKVHYFVSDATGDCAVIEFIKGRLVVHRGDGLQYPQITNDTCAECLRQIGTYQGFGGSEAIPRDNHSMSRYARLARAAQQAEADRGEAHELAFDTIRTVSHRSTRWQIVYDLQSKKMYLRTQQQPTDRVIDLGQCQFDPARPARVLDIETPLRGNVVSKFRDYTREANKRLIEQSVAATSFTRDMPTAIVQMVIDYPDHACTPIAAEVSEAAR
ncbi:linear amide C-N hydrolase [Aeoliella sp. ICT_H6.2]|uniref:Linear amide C-N hydrolase n=1 Tax=Aeoliella straminimaris TaxID=2954799 RepID=A0A9X2F861_9BACT|nr:linear amide C-N hydrolase [Aeoliella straminimaris]MCO6043357.1 linear amide C-N hydrolase [Aeoliella straminimaris]